MDSASPLPPAADTQPGLILPGDEALCSLDLAVGGMTCSACVGRVERALAQVPGVVSASVNLVSGVARVVHHTATDNTQDKQLQTLLRRAVRQAGYEPLSQAPQAMQAAPTRWAGFAPIAWGMVLSLPLLLPMLAMLFGVMWALPVWLAALLGSAVQFTLGLRFYRGAWYALRQGAANMDVLVALGTTAAWALSVVLWWQAPAGGQPQVYFEASAVVITLVLWGKWLEERAKRQMNAAIRALHALRPEQAHLWRDGQESDIPVADLLVGDEVRIRPGERCPADGVLLHGPSTMDESLLTGEAQPVPKPVGAALTAGAINGQGHVHMRVQAVGADTVLAHIIRLVEDAQAAKAPIQRLVDRVAAVFVPGVLLLALLTFLGWHLSGAGLDQSVLHAVAVLVIACPCALGLATPVAIMVGTGVAAKHGVLIKDAQVLSVADRVSLVVFDKTGTLTVGQPRLLHLDVAAGIRPSVVLHTAARLQASSEHPLAQAVRLAASAGVMPGPAQGFEPAQAVQSLPGLGLEGVVDGQSVRMGSWAWMVAMGAQAPDLATLAQTQMDTGASVAALAVQQAGSWQVQAVLAFGDEPKPDAAAALARLRARGLKLCMLSGDHVQAAQAMAQRLGLQPEEVIAGVSPADKAAQVQRFRDAGEVVAMVGDGVNDAPALAAADLGLAMGQGTDVAMHAAGITLMRGELMGVADALDIAQRTLHKIQHNLFWALAYNVAGLPLAAMGWLNPMVAGAAMGLSSVSVMASALWLRRWQPQR